MVAQSPQRPGAHTATQPKPEQNIIFQLIFCRNKLSNKAPELPPLFQTLSRHPRARTALNKDEFKMTNHFLYYYRVYGASYILFVFPCELVLSAAPQLLVLSPLFKAVSLQGEKTKPKNKAEKPSSLVWGSPTCLSAEWDPHCSWQAWRQ